MKRNLTSPLGEALYAIEAIYSVTDGRGFVHLPRSKRHFVKKVSGNYYVIDNEYLVLVNNRGIAIFRDNGFGDEAPQNNWMTPQYGWGSKQAMGIGGLTKEEAKKIICQ